MVGQTRSDPRALSCAAEHQARDSPPRAQVPHGIPHKSSARRCESRTTRAPAATQRPSHPAAQNESTDPLAPSQKTTHPAPPALCPSRPHFRRHPASPPAPSQAHPSTSHHAKPAHPVPANLRNPSHAVRMGASWASHVRSPQPARPGFRRDVPAPSASLPLPASTSFSPNFVLAESRALTSHWPVAVSAIAPA